MNYHQCDVRLGYNNFCLYIKKKNKNVALTAIFRWLDLWVGYFVPIKAINKIAYRDFFLRSLLIKSLPKIKKKIAIPTMESIIILNLVKAVHKFQSQTTLFAYIVTFIFFTSAKWEQEVCVDFQYPPEITHFQRFWVRKYDPPPNCYHNWFLVKICLPKPEVPLNFINFSLFSAKLGVLGACK